MLRGRLFQVSRVLLTMILRKICGKYRDRWIACVYISKVQMLPMDYLRVWVLVPQRTQAGNILRVLPDFSHWI